ncbi:MAG: putative Diguanylate cyclase/phosphodiesterase [Acidimicrobiales bacterium]|nr:putative Diguanylate cyclase/phosphodiesterase [Acidimicrobiales bacterium]
MEEHLTGSVGGAQAVGPERGPALVLALDTAVLTTCVPLLWWLHTFHQSVSVPVAVAVGLLFLVAEWFPVDVEIRQQGHTVAFTAVPLIIGLCTLPPLLVLGLRLASSVFVLGLLQRQSPVKFVTNVVSHGLQIGVAAAILVPLAPGTPEGLRSWGVAALAVAASEVAGAIMVTAAISIFEGGFDREFLPDIVTGWAVLLPDVALGLLAAILLDLSPGTTVLLVGIGGCMGAVVRGYAKVTARYRVLETLDSFTHELGLAVLAGRVRMTLLEQLRQRLHADVAWIQVAGEASRCAELRGAADVPTEVVLPRHPGPNPTPTAHDMVGVVHVGDERLLIGVDDRLGDVRAFDGEDVRLFELLIAHASVALQNVQLVDQLRDEVAINEGLATRDQLTGLPNRRLFILELEAALRFPLPFGVLLLGLDRFKEVNDTLSHQTGDELLVEVGRRLRDALPAVSAVARTGGDEFAVLLVGDDADELRDQAERALAAVDGSYHLAGMDLDVSASGGLARTGTAGTAAVTLLRQADVAMYQAKAARQPFREYAADRDTSSPARLAMAGRLRTAIARGDLTLEYQPQVDLTSGRVVGVEALVRWRPEGQPVSPVEFIEVAERTGLIRPLTELVLRQAMRQCAEWAEAGMALRVSANLSTRNIEDPHLVGLVSSLLAEHEGIVGLFEVEVTETSVMVDPDACTATLQAFHDLGLHISIDDFGTGHSSLAYLTKLPVDQLKIDRSFVTELTKPGSGQAVVHAIIDLGRHLGLEVVAEGIETRSQLEALTAMGCAIGQGYYYARPLPAADVPAWVAHHEGATRPPRRLVSVTGAEPQVM